MKANVGRSEPRWVRRTQAAGVGHQDLRVGESTVADGAATTHPDPRRAEGFGPSEASLSLCGWVKGRVGLPGCPIGAEDTQGR